MDDMTFELVTRKEVIVDGFMLMTTTLQKSHGEAEMSAEDTKLIAMALRGIVTHQQSLIETLYREVSRMKNKSFLDRLFNR